MGSLDSVVFGKKKFSNILRRDIQQSKEKRKTNIGFNI